MSIGSTTAKNGFRNEDEIVAKFNDWESDADAQEWLSIMGYEIDKIENVKAIKISGQKTDIQVQIEIMIKLKGAVGIENIQIKLVSNKSGFNQIDKRWVKEYVKMWDIPDDVADLLKRYCGELKPNISNPRDERRMFIDEFAPMDQEKLIDFFKNHKFLIVSDILRGRGAFATEWILVVQKFNGVRWLLITINKAINFYGNQEVVVTNTGNLRIGKIGVQRKGGDGGKPTANMLQFKLDPIDMFTPFCSFIKETEEFQ